MHIANEEMFHFQIVFDYRNKPSICPKWCVDFSLKNTNGTLKRESRQGCKVENVCSSSSYSLVQFSRSVVSDSLWPHGLQHARLPCLSPTPRACSNSCQSSQWCHLTISPSVIPSPPAFSLSQHQGLFPVSEFFASHGQSIGLELGSS